jgi:hypothetical protein
MATIELRTFTYIDILQAQLASFISTISQGFFPLEGQASLFVEVRPGISINIVTDIVLKHAEVTPGMQIVERAYGMLEIHSWDQGQVRAAGQAILQFYGMEEKDRLKPVIMTHEIITGIEGHQAMILNRNRMGEMLLEDETLYILECNPAGYAAFACNEAEKAANIHVLDVHTFGAFGRVYLGGTEEEINQAAHRIQNVLNAIEGRTAGKEKYV